MNNKKSRKSTKSDEVFDAIVILIGTTAKTFWYGIQRYRQLSLHGWLLIASITVLVTSISYKKVHIIWIEKFLYKFIPSLSVWHFVQYDFKIHLFVLLVCFFTALTLMLGFSAYIKKKRYQDAIDWINIRNGKGHLPTIINIKEINKHRTKITLKSKGIGLSDYTKNVERLEAAFDLDIEEVKKGYKPSLIDIYLTSRKLPRKVLYRNVIGEIKDNYHFTIGDSLSGVITQNLADLPHLLIAGTTGAGKSLFFKQALLSLLENSAHIRMYLIDLKGGIEMSDFKNCPNVTILKDVNDAVIALQEVEREMRRRFKYLEANGLKQIDPARDKMDAIIVGIDEASVLYGKHSSSSDNKKLVQLARELTDSIAKLSRAAKIHLILATQKVTKETIGTHIQDNISGKVCFKVQSVSASNTVLGNKMAVDLPKIPGRAIWHIGHEYLEFQAPYIDSKEIHARCLNIKEEFKEGKRSSFCLSNALPAESKEGEGPISGMMKGKV